MLHCLRIELPALPQPGTGSWYRQEEYAQNLDNANVESRDNSPSLLEKSAGDNQNALDMDAVAAAAGIGSPIEGVDDSRSSSSSSRRPACVQMRDVGEHVGDIGEESESDLVDDAWSDTCGDLKLGGVIGGGWDKGLSVCCPPPKDFMQFLRSVPWWEEGLIDAAEKAGE